MRIVLIGPPGSGKGTQAEKISEAYGIAHVSTGDLMRAEIARGTELGLQIKPVIDGGNLVSDDVTTDLLKKKLADCRSGFVLDGYPRTLNQANILEKISKIDHAVYIELSEKEIIKRLTNRVQCKYCQSIYGAEMKHEIRCPKCGGELYKRTDDTKTAVKNRLLSFHESNAPILEFYEGKNMLRRIDGNKTADEVFAQIQRVID